MSGLFPEESSFSSAVKLLSAEALLTLLTQPLSFHDFMREVLLVFQRAIKSEAGSIFELDQANHTLFFRAVSGQSSDKLGQFQIPVGQGVVGHVAESRLPTVVNDLSQNQNFMKTIQDAVQFQTRNLIAAPIVVRGRLYGVVELINRVGENEFGAGDLELITYLSGLAARTIEVRMMLAWNAQARTEKVSA